MLRLEAGQQLISELWRGSILSGSASELLPRRGGCASVVSRARQTGRARPTWVPWLYVGLDSVRSGPSGTLNRFSSSNFPFSSVLRI